MSGKNEDRRASKFAGTKGNPMKPVAWPVVNRKDQPIKPAAAPAAPKK